MEELTLSGATLLNKQDSLGGGQQLHGHNHSATNIEMVSSGTSASSHHHHHHDHHSHAGSHTAHSHGQFGGGQGGSGAGDACCDKHRGMMQRPRVALQMPPEELVKQEPVKIIQALTVVTRMGDYDLFAKLVQAWKNHLLVGQTADEEAWQDILRQIFREHGVVDGSFGDGKHTLLHWAAKRKDDARFVQFWSAYISVNLKTADSTAMTCLHWACTEGPNLPVIRHLIEASKKEEQPSLMETVDASGCTPLLIAAQYGQVEAVAYLIQKGANRHALDGSRDSALHWAAYKGNANVLGLLLYYDVEDHQPQVTAPDVYGQTPLHLAALRGQKGVCRYLLEHLSSSSSSSSGSGGGGRVEVRRLLHMADKNGRTPEALAKHKEKIATAAFLNDYYANHVAVHQRAGGMITREITAFVRNLRSVHRWRVCLGIASAEDEMDEAPHVPFYYTLLQIVGNILFYFTVLMPIFNGDYGVLFDYALLHLFNICIMAACVTFWIWTWKTDPGRLVSKNNNKDGGKSLVPPSELAYWRKLYEDTLEAYADESRHEMAQSIQLCHTCHIARPPRSKHDRYSRCCVLMFDHMYVFQSRCPVGKPRF